LTSYKKKIVWNEEVYDTSQDVKAEKPIYFLLFESKLVRNKRRISLKERR